MMTPIDPCASDAKTLLERFHARAAEYYVARIRPLTVEVVVAGHPACGKRFTLGADLTSTPTATAHTDADATIELDAKTLAAILALPSTFDPRQPKFVTRLRIAGDKLSAYSLLQFLKRPTPAARARLERARAIAPARLAAIPEIAGTDPATAKSHVFDTLAASCPLCVRGLLDWPAVKWNLDELAARYGDVPLLRNDLQAGCHESLRDFLRTFHRAAGACRSPSHHDAAAPYTDGCPLPAELCALFPFPIFPDAAFSPPQLWFGARRMDKLVTWLHCDLMSSFLAQVSGRKKVRLYAPAQHTMVYPLDTYNTYQPCHVDAARPDLDRFPLFAAARPLDIVLTPGDLLIVPAGWYHCVWALDDVLSVSRFIDEAVVNSW